VKKKYLFSINIFIILFVVGCGVPQPQTTKKTKQKKIVGNRVKITQKKSPKTIDIKILTSNLNTKEAFKIGDELKITIATKPNLKIFALFPGILDHIEFIELSKGIYKLNYTIDQKIDAQGYIKYLIHKHEFIDNNNFIVFDNTPPGTPTVTYNVLNNNVNIILHNNIKDDVSRYVVEGLLDGEYKIVASSYDDNNLTFPIEQGEEMFIRAYFEDKAQNISTNLKQIKISNYDDNLNY